MKKSFVLLLVACIVLYGCKKDNDDELTNDSAKITINFTHKWDDIDIAEGDFNTIQYKNGNGEDLSIERLRYLVSNFAFEDSEGKIMQLPGYNLVDLTNGTDLSYQLPDTIEAKDYTNLYFTFGFNNEDNRTGAYLDLNSVLWNVPEMLGGGYHYMQLEGKFIDANDAETGYQYHAIRAVDSSGEELVFEDTFFIVDLGPITIEGDTNIEIKMNIAEWFKNPNLWNLNELHSMMMPNFEAQKMISQNGKTVFSLGKVSTP